MSILNLCTAFAIAGCIDLTATDSDDHMDIITASSATLTSPDMHSSKLDASTSGVSSDRVLRTRSKTSKSAPDHLTTRRKRALSISATEAEKAKLGQKKTKLEDKRAFTVVANATKVFIEAARRRWLDRHCDLFIPLLPPRSTLFENISTDNEAYVPQHELHEQPKLVKGGEMKEYQLQGLSFLAWMHHNGMNCILGDEMGLGKTLQTLSLFAYIKENSKGNQDPHLVICPLSVLPSWLSEAARWIPSFRTLRFHGQRSERERLKYCIRDGEIKFNICITTYETYLAEESWFKTRRWTYCVLDEGHRIKNAETDIAGKLQGLGSLYRLILTGTPIQNNLVELWSILHWLYPSIFTDASKSLFKDSFDLTRGLYSIPILKATETLLSTVMLRRTKATVEMSVPPREELTVYVPMMEAQRFWTYRLLTRMDTIDLKEIFMAKLEDNEHNEGRKEVQRYLASHIYRNKTGEQSQWTKLMNLLMQLRKTCDHPYLLADAEPDPYIIGEHLVASSSKLMVVDKLLADILPKKERALIFSQWTNMLDLLEDFLTLRNIQYARLDGSTSRPRRALDIKLFQQENSPYQVFLISTKAGGLGINLTKATTVIMFDSDWNPQNDLQAIARAHRIGQTKVVKVYRLICQGSVEEQMLERIRRKLFLSMKVMDSDNPASDERNLAFRTTELLKILRKGSSALSNDNNSMDLAQFVEASIQDILAVSRERDDVHTARVKHQEGMVEGTVDQKILDDMEDEERRLLAGVAQVQSRLFEGKVVHQANDNKQIANEWKALQKRSRENRIVMVDGMKMIAAHMGPEVPSVAPVGKDVLKRGNKKYDSEDWCIYCRDGGELVLCNHCPRVFHAACHGMTKADLKRSLIASCPQHHCVSCNRTTADVGNMLFRCQTCPQAFCEDCLPDGDIDAVGDTLPEFLLLGFGARTTAYYIRCNDCRRRFAEDPQLWEAWQGEVRDVQARLDALQD
ncbi:hypothetical protein AcV7_010039 [Taiwanofungus camphoratus]|nr:hypothetical protein AcV7_010039 [Antrodia cinnamomea]